MKTPHKHAEVIKAWADGHKVQVLSKSGSWNDVDQPGWYECYEYRIKPEPRKGWYRVALFREQPDMRDVAIVSNLIEEASAERNKNFSRWLTPRTEYEVHE